MTRLYYMTTPHEARGPVEPELAKVIDLLAKQPEWPAPKVDEAYAWDCGCTFRYLAGDWRTQQVCERHKGVVKGKEVGCGH